MYIIQYIIDYEVRSSLFDHSDHHISQLYIEDMSNIPPFIHPLCDSNIIKPDVRVQHGNCMAWYYNIKLNNYGGRATKSDITIINKILIFKH